MKFKSIVQSMMHAGTGIEPQFEMSEYVSSLPGKPKFLKHEQNFIEENKFRSSKIRALLDSLSKAD